MSVIREVNYGWSIDVFVCYLFRVYKNYSHTHTHCDVQLNTYSRIYNPEQSLGTDFHWGLEIIYQRCKADSEGRGVAPQ